MHASSVRLSREGGLFGAWASGVPQAGGDALPAERDELPTGQECGATITLRFQLLLLWFYFHKLRAGKRALSPPWAVEALPNGGEGCELEQSRSSTRILNPCTSAWSRVRSEAGIPHPKRGPLSPPGHLQRQSFEGTSTTFVIVGSCRRDAKAGQLSGRLYPRY
jgi:hypothetical protein